MLCVLVFFLYIHIYSIDAFCFSYFAWVFTSSSSSSVISTAAFARNIYVMSRIMHGFRGDCDSVCAIKCDKYYCFCFTIQMKKERKKNRPSEKSTKWVSNERDLCSTRFDRQRMQNAKKVDWMQRFFFAYFFSLSFIWLHVEHTIVISMYLKHKNQPTMQKKLIILLSLFFSTLDSFRCLALFSRKLHSITTQRMECAPRKFA